MSLQLGLLPHEAMRGVHQTQAGGRQPQDLARKQQWCKHWHEQPAETYMLAQHRSSTYAPLARCSLRQLSWRLAPSMACTRAAACLWPARSAASDPKGRGAWHVAHCGWGG